MRSRKKKLIGRADRGRCRGFAERPLLHGKCCRLFLLATPGARHGSWGARISSLGARSSRMPSYDPALPMRQARAAYFAASGFSPDGGYGDRWVKLKIGRFFLPFSNTAA